jgi:small subunit ribosomal protein S21
MYSSHVKQIIKYMLIVKVQKDNLNRALKQFKRKFRDTQVLKEIRERKNYTKKSLKRKIEKENAIRKLKKQQDDE